jgi:mannose-1-phosphate guanylyltransferase
MTLQVQPVIMAGGSGTRLWPLSRAGFPKQFLVLSGNTSLFQQALSRLQGLGGEGLELAAPLIVGNEEHRFLVLDQLRELGIDPAAALLEPSGRNTAPALTLAALQATEGDADPVLVVTPADQTVADESAFRDAVRDAVALAAGGAITILGVRPERPEIGYGYICAARDTGRAGSPPGGWHVERFVEKPDLATAERYVAEGSYFWNAGMFVLRASVWLAALQRFRPDIAAATPHRLGGAQDRPPLRAPGRGCIRRRSSPAAPASSAATSCSTGWRSRRAVVNLDKLTYAGNLQNLASLQGDARHVFVQGDIGDRSLVDRLLAEHRPRAVLTSRPKATSTAHPRPRRLHPDQHRRHLHAAGSRRAPLERRRRRNPRPPFRFHARQHRRGLWQPGPRRSGLHRDASLRAQQPVLASKAASDHLVRAWHHTYGLPVLTTNCSNNYGPYHFPEKLIPLMIVNALAASRCRSTATAAGARLAVCEDHCSAIRRVLEAAARRDLQHRRLEREAQHRHRAHRLRLARRTAPPRRRQGPPRPRPRYRSRSSVNSAGAPATTAATPSTARASGDRELGWPPTGREPSRPAIGWETRAVVPRQPEVGAPRRAERRLAPGIVNAAATRPRASPSWRARSTPPRPACWRRRPRRGRLAAALQHRLRLRRQRRPPRAKTRPPGR